MTFNHISNSFDKKELNKMQTTEHWVESFYWSFKTSGKIQPLPKINSFFNYLKSNANLIGKISTNDIDYLNEEIHKSKINAELLKEYIFEDVRLNFFPTKPSRKNCIFLIPKEVDIQLFAQKFNIGNKESNIWEVEVLQPMNIHYANTIFLNCDNFPHSEKLKNAMRYWEGTNSIDLETEVLYSGKFKLNLI